MYKRQAQSVVVADSLRSQHVLESGRTRYEGEGNTHLPPTKSSCLIEEDPMVAIGERVRRQGRLLQLPLATVAAMFTHTSADTTLCNSDVNLAARAEHTTAVGL